MNAKTVYWLVILISLSLSIHLTILLHRRHIDSKSINSFYDAAWIAQSQLRPKTEGKRIRQAREQIRRLRLQISEEFGNAAEALKAADYPEEARWAFDTFSEDVEKVKLDLEAAHRELDMELRQ